MAVHFPGSILAGFERLTGGVSADVTRLDLEAHNGRKRSVILREHGATHDGNELTIEFATLKALHDSGLAVPKPLASDSSRKLLDHPWLLMDFVAGSAGFEDRDSEARIDAMADQMISLHKEGVGELSVLPKTLDPLPELREWTGEREEWRELAAVLQGLEDTSYTGELALLHGDFWPGNIIWDENGAIRAILDWEDASLGDPIFDVACTCLELRYLFGKTGADSFRKAYAAQRPIDPARFALWQAYAGVWAYDAMANWRLEPQREAKMRRDALDTVHEALCVLRS